MPGQLVSQLAVLARAGVPTGVRVLPELKMALANSELGHLTPPGPLTAAAASPPVLHLEGGVVAGHAAHTGSDGGQANEDLGDRRPSQMLAAMLEFYPPGEEATAFFRAAYLSRLPADIRGHLDGLETGVLKDLAARADSQWANGRGAISPVAAVEAVTAAAGLDDDADPVAAVGSGNLGKNKFFFNKKCGGVAGGGSSASGSGDSNGGCQRSGWVKMTQLTVCQRHLQFGEDAHTFGDPNACQYSKLGN